MFNPKKHPPEHSLKRRGLLRSCDCRQLQDHRSLENRNVEDIIVQKVWSK